MKVAASLLTFLASGALVFANPHDSAALSARHARLAHRAPVPASPEQLKKRRCKPRASSSVAVSTASAAHITAPANDAVVKTTAKQEVKTTTAKAAPTKAATNQAVSVPQSAGGLLSVKSSCGNIGATKDITATSGPNGNIDWLNCGVTDGGWRPPFIQVSQLVTAELSSAVKAPNSPFKACSAYVPMFEKYASQHGLPAIMLASFAMQESSCNPHTVGGAGEQGLMQITKDKCGGAPGGNCMDPDFNIATGAAYFASTLKGNNGDVLKSIGGYNGWFDGMTYGQATAAAKTSCCRCQNNLDYLHQFLNGWCQNVDAYDNSPRLGKYFNLDKC